MKEFQINGVKIRQGQAVNIELPIAKLPTHTLIDLPIFIRSAKEEGPVVLVSGGVHGDEINGIITAKRILEEIDNGLELLRGTLIIIPLVNIYGFLSNSRTFPDGRDLNRSFPGSKKGSLAGRIAYILNEQIIPHIDYGIDFHTGGRMLTNHPQIRVDFQDKKAIELAMLFHLDMLESGPEKKETVILQSSDWIRARSSGIFNSSVRLGDEVKKGQVVARISDPYGHIKIPIKAPSNGYVIGINNLPVINVGEALIHLGKA